MQAVYELTPVIAAIISGQCPGTRAREELMSACIHSDWDEARVMVEGMVAARAIQVSKYDGFGTSAVPTRRPSRLGTPKISGTRPVSASVSLTCADRLATGYNDRATLAFRRKFGTPPFHLLERLALGHE